MMQNKQSNCDVIIVGAGPSGVAAAITLARANKKVVIIERSSKAGSKNMFGGAVFKNVTESVYPNFLKEAPIERIITSHSYSFLKKDNSTTFSYKNSENNAFSVIRAKFDDWCIQEAKKAGAYFIYDTLVEDLIIENKKIIGVRTELENYYAPITILADGVNSHLAEKAGLKAPLSTNDVALSVKEVYKIPKEKIEERFNLEDKTGAMYEFFGGTSFDILNIGFLYTNQNSISIGIGILLEDLKELKLKPYELLNELKENKLIKPLIKDGELLEYSAHLIPEGGYNSIPKLFYDGLMIVGDSAMLVNSVHFEGTNLSMESGKLAGETALIAFEKQDFSSKTLKLYKKKLENSFVLKDMKTYRNTIKSICKNKKVFLGYYPEKLNEFFGIFTTANSIPKKQLFRKYIFSFIKERKLSLFKDLFNLIKISVDILK